MDHANDKKTSRSNVISLKNGHDFELLLQPNGSQQLGDWIKILKNHVS